MFINRYIYFFNFPLAHLNRTSSIIETSLFLQEFYQEEFEKFKGNVTLFSKVGKFIQKYFEKPLEIVANQ